MERLRTRQPLLFRKDSEGCGVRRGAILNAGLTPSRYRERSMDAHPLDPAATAGEEPAAARGPPGFAAQVKSGVLWRSGSQLIGQLIAWTSTFLVIRLLNPSDYGLVAMTGVILTF